MDLALVTVPADVVRPAGEKVEIDRRPGCGGCPREADEVIAEDVELLLGPPSPLPGRHQTSYRRWVGDSASGMPCSLVATPTARRHLIVMVSQHGQTGKQGAARPKPVRRRRVRASD